VTGGPLELPASPRRVRLAARSAGFSGAALDRALEFAAATPGPDEWRRFLGRALALFGSALLLAGVICFVAYNWARIGRFEKFALVEVSIVIATVVGWLRLPRLSGRLALAGAAVLVGPLFALYGQTYQTGADPYGLFLVWLVLIVPWVIVARLGVLWLIALLLVDTAAVLFSLQVLDPDPTGAVLRAPLSVGVAHLFAVAAWEWQRRRTTPWLDEEWVPRTAAAVGFTALWLVASATIIEPDDAGLAGAMGLLVLGLSIAAGFHYHRRVRADRFMVAAAVGTGMMLASVLVGRILFGVLDLELAGFFLMAAFLIWEITLGVSWFRGSRPDTASEA
jgi:uncharacterized membrane protein